MSDFVGTVQEQREVAAYQHALTLLPESTKGPRPWCRVCKHEVTDWGWTRYADFWGVWISCHGDLCGGLLPPFTDRFYYRLEAFCYDDPRMTEFPLWWVSYTGQEIQASRKYLDYAIQSGQDHPVFAGWFGRSVRFLAPAISLAMLAWGWWFARQW